jgi:glycosyltransferase involved in cell wall biosynthesis
MIALMTVITNGAFDAPPGYFLRLPARQHRPVRDAETLRRCAWEVGEARAADAYVPPENYAALAGVSPYQGFAYWNILPGWVERTRHQHGHAWHGCRLILRLYDVSYLEFTGLNAHSMQDHNLPRLDGQFFFKLARPGTSQIAEVGFLLQSGEFIPAARSQTVRFAPDAPSHQGGHAALLVDAHGRCEDIGNVWEQEHVLRERRRPRVRQPLRIAAFAFRSLLSGQQDASARFVSELARGQVSQGHEVHVFVPRFGELTESRTIDGVQYHPLEPVGEGAPVELAQRFATVAGAGLKGLPAFDVVHLHEWMTAWVPRPDGTPALLSLTSLESSRRNGTAPTLLSRTIEEAERGAAAGASLVLTPHWLHERAAPELGLDEERIVPFPIEGRGPNEWECPLDLGRVKETIGLGPMDRLILFVGPLEHAAGVDLLVEALPTLLPRWGNLRLAFAGSGNMWSALEHRAGQLGVSHAVRLLGHVERAPLARLLRAAAALVLPSRYRVPLDDAVVDLARRAGRPVVTTTGGPAHLVRHEENGVVTYDNPGSMVWAIDRILGDPWHADRMGQNGRRASGEVVATWDEVVRHYLELCASQFPELRGRSW